MSKHPFGWGLGVGWLFGRRRHRTDQAVDPEAPVDRDQLRGPRRAIRQAGIQQPTPHQQLDERRAALGRDRDPDPDHDDHDDPDELDDQPTDRPGPMGPGRPQPVPAMPDRRWLPDEDDPPPERQPLLPAALQHPGQAAELAARHAAFVTVFHLSRIPLYLWHNLCWAPAGGYRLVVGLARWARVHDAREAEAGAAQLALDARDNASFQTWHRIHNSRRDQAKKRFWAAVFVAACVAGSLALAVAQGPLATAATVVGLVVVLGWFGRPADRPYIESAVVASPRATRITADMIGAALVAAKLCKEIDGPGGPEYQTPVMRDGDGWGVVLDLPLGVTAEKAIAARQEIAAGLRRKEAQVFLSEVNDEAGHAGRVRIWVADRDPMALPPIPSPLGEMSKFDFWTALPFGRNEHGRLVSLIMVWSSLLIGALPRMGKTYAMRLVIAAAALDPHVRLLMWDGKGGADFTPWEKICHRFGAGADDHVCKALLDALRELVKDMDRRFADLRDLGKHSPNLVREAKVTRVLSRDPRMNMPLTLVCIDEFQEYLGNRVYGAEVLECLIALARRGPAAGIMLALATQRPSRETIPTDLRDLLGTRFAMRTMGWQASEMVLGSGTKVAGMDASRLPAKKRGVGWLLGTGDGELTDAGGQLVHTHLMDLDMALKVAERAHALRTGAGTLTGVAAGEQPEDLSDRVLEHVRQAFYGEAKAQSAVLLERMQSMWPALYETWSVTDLAAALGRYGIPGGQQVWVADPDHPKGGTNRKGFHLDQVMDAIARRMDDDDGDQQWPETGT